MKTDPVSMLQIASTLAARAHAWQCIRSTDIPYIAHPVAVSMAVTCLFGCSDPEVAAAALLHDTLEKTRLSAEEISDVLGPGVLRLVISLTKDEGGDKNEYWGRLHDDVWEARLIKMADALDHLDCPPDELERRIRTGRLAVGLAHSAEAPIRRAHVILNEALDKAEIRIGMLA